MHEVCKGQGRPCLASLLNRTTDQWRRSKRPQQMPEGGDSCHAGRDSSLGGEEDPGSRRAVWYESSSRKAGPAPCPPPPYTRSVLPASFRPPGPQAKGTCPPPTPCKFQQAAGDTRALQLAAGKCPHAPPPGCPRINAGHGDVEFQARGQQQHALRGPAATSKLTVL